MAKEDGTCCLVYLGAGAELFPFHVLATDSCLAPLSPPTPQVGAAPSRDPTTGAKQVVALAELLPRRER